MKINVGRVILGGIVAGIVINLIEGVMNGIVLVNQWSEQMASLNRSAAGSVRQIIALNIWGFAAGILLVWLYATMRARFGAGPRTAIVAAVFIWATICVMGNTVPIILGVYRLDLGLIGMGYELPEMILAALAGCRIYKESAADPAKAMSARI